MKAWRLIYIITISATALLMLLRYWDPAPTQVLRQRVFDFYQRVQPRVASELPVVIVDLDEESLKAYGQWPWPRTLLADLVTELGRSGAAAIGLNIVFPEPDRSSPGKFAESLRGIDSHTREQLENLPSNDTVFARALARFRVVLGQSTTTRETGPSDEAKPRKTALVRIGGEPAPFLLNFLGITRNLPELEEAAKGLGMLTLVPEFDGVVRRVPLVVRVGDEVYPSLAVEMLRVATGQGTIALKSDVTGFKSVIVAGTEIATDAAGRYWLHYAPHDQRRYISAGDVLDGTVPRERLAGRLVLIGTSAVGLLDFKGTPIDDAMPSVEVQAQVLEAILSQAQLRRPAYAAASEVFIIFVFGALLLVEMRLLGAVWALITGGVVLASLGATSWYLYSRQGVLLDVVYPALAMFFIYTLLSSMRYISEESERREVRRAFSQYISPSLVEQLAANPKQLKLGGEIKPMSILFSDIRGFTNISESYKDDPEGLTHLINRYFTAMTDRILEYGGTIDKYMGDAVMAFWNAPLDDAQHARHACEAALEMLDGLNKLNRKLRADAEARGIPFVPVDIGIGVNTGNCLVGNMGSEHRFTYSVIGDDVNLASRLEGQCRTYGVKVIIGENTYAIADDFAALELDLIKVKGKDEAVRIYCLLGLPRVRDREEFQALSNHHHAMLAAYRRQDWGAARESLSECRNLNNDLGQLYGLFSRRIDMYEASPPGADWDGVFVATTK